MICIVTLNPPNLTTIMMVKLIAQQTDPEEKRNKLQSQIKKGTTTFLLWIDQLFSFATTYTWSLWEHLEKYVSKLRFRNLTDKGWRRGWGRYAGTKISKWMSQLFNTACKVRTMICALLWLSYNFCLIWYTSTIWRDSPSMIYKINILPKWISANPNRDAKTKILISFK